VKSEGEKKSKKPWETPEERTNTLPAKGGIIGGKKKKRCYTGKEGRVSDGRRRRILTLGRKGSDSS